MDDTVSIDRTTEDYRRWYDDLGDSDPWGIITVNIASLRNLLSQAIQAQDAVEMVAIHHPEGLDRAREIKAALDHRRSARDIGNHPKVVALPRRPRLRRI